MKTNFLKSMRTGSKRRGLLALLSFAAVVLLIFSSSVAQQKNPRRVTGLQLGDAFEGSRVTVVSDTALSDYEAYRRGDRFYIKIPLADFASAVPHFRANGFDDVQVQRIGDGLIVSFKLQPGATARVDQRGNRLDVIFSAPNRSSLVAGRTSIPASRVDNSQASSARGPDAAGPLPPGSAPGSRDRVVSETTSPNEGGVSPDPWAINAGGIGGRRGKRGNQTQNANNQVAQQPTASPILSPATTSTYPSTYSTPISSPAVGATTTSRSGSLATLRNSSVYKWISANRLASLLGALILLSLLAYLLMVLRGRRNEAKANRAKALKVQPKYSSANELNEAPVSAETTPPVSSLKGEPAARVSNVVSNGVAMRSATPETRPAPTASAPKAAAAVATSHGSGPVEDSSEQEEREVFEL